MPNIKSAIKRVKTTETRSMENASVKSAYKTAVKKFKVAAESGEKEQATTLFKDACKIIDKAANKNVIKANTASRKKSSLAKELNAMK